MQNVVCVMGKGDKEGDQNATFFIFVLLMCVHIN